MSPEIPKEVNADERVTPQTDPVAQPDDAQKTITIDIVRHKRLFELLESPRSLWKVIASLFVIVIVLFVGLAFVVLVVKSFYPYNVIKTNTYGATIMQTEDKEVIYWLFNTAELWANSGIEVKKNERISIRASGAANTAIHYLVDAANEDRQPGFGWVGTEGFERKGGHHDFRDKYKLAPDEPFGVLLMQVIPYEHSKKDIGWYKNPDNDVYLDGLERGSLHTTISVISKERVDYVVPCDGVLHFAVNDVVMTDTVIRNMYLASMKTLRDSLATPDASLDRVIAAVEQHGLDATVKETHTIALPLKLKDGTVADAAVLKARSYGMGYYYNGREVDKTNYPVNNELYYYKEKKFRDPWFADNVGSFLVVIERNTQQK